MAKWEVSRVGDLEVDGRKIAYFPISSAKYVDAIARKLNAFDEMLAALKAVDDYEVIHHPQDSMVRNAIANAEAANV